MSDCCGEGKLDVTHTGQQKTLKVVLAINAIMFFLVVYAAFYAKSTALMSESLDYLGDSLTYALSFAVVHMGLQVKAKVAFFKGLLILAAGIFVASQIVEKLINPALPLFETMGIFGLLGLVANGACLFLLWRHKDEDINMNSVWECSRNDIAAGIAVFIAALGVWATDSMWPDLAVAIGLMILFFRSSYRVLKSSWTEMNISHE